MQNNIIKFNEIINEEKISSFTFYSKIIPYINYLFKNYEINIPFVFDMEGIRNIEPIVIPYIASLGEWCNFKSNCTTIFMVPATRETEELQKYLSAIDFKENYKEIFDFSEIKSWRYTSDSKTQDGLDLINKSTKSLNIQFDKIYKSSSNMHELTRASVWDWITAIFYTPSFTSTRAKFFLDELLPGDEARYFSAEMTRVMAELTHNALFHGHSNCYILCQYLNKKKILKIGLSDSGLGMAKTFDFARYSKFKSVDVKKFKDDASDYELRALIECLLFRIWRRNGLFGVIYTVLENKGTVRIHSSRCQIILTNKAKSFFSYSAMQKFSEGDESIKQEFLDYLYWNPANIEKSNVRCTDLFPGVHFELEMPVPHEYR